MFLLYVPYCNKATLRPHYTFLAMISVESLNTKSYNTEQRRAGIILILKTILLSNH